MFRFLIAIHQDTWYDITDIDVEGKTDVEMPHKMTGVPTETSAQIYGNKQ